MNEKIFDIERENFCETVFIDKIVEKLDQKIDNYSIICTGNIYKLPKYNYDKVIVLLVGDEYGGPMPYYKNEKITIFRHHNAHEQKFDNKTIFRAVVSVFA